MGTTSNYSWPYPESTDPVADGAADIQALADAADTTGRAIELATVQRFADATARNTALAGIEVEGMFAFLQDTDVLTYWDGSAWQEFSAGATPFDIEYLVIAGGGSGSPASAGGGGGAGGYRCSFGTDPSGGGGSTETPLTATVPGSVLVVVGGGGAYGAYTQAPASTLGYRGPTSTTITSIGGGFGPGYNQNGTSGGSGSGAHAPDGTTVRTGGAGTANQGYNGGNSTNVSSWGVGGGGGGAGGAATGPEDGGVGLASSITGTSVTRAGGGGGGQDSRGGTSRRGTGGTGGGGNGGGTATAGTANTGSGGGGGGYPGAGANGGSGIVIIRFPNTIPDPTIGPGLTYSSSTSGSDKIIQFTAGTDVVTWSA